MRIKSKRTRYVVAIDIFFSSVGIRLSVSVRDSTRDRSIFSLFWLRISLVFDDSCKLSRVIVPSNYRSIIYFSVIEMDEVIKVHDWSRTDQIEYLDSLLILSSISTAKKDSFAANNAT